MTDAPEPRCCLALVAIHLSLPMVVAPQRSGTVAHGNVPRGRTHRLSYPRCICPSGTTTICPQGKAKT